MLAVDLPQQGRGEQGSGELPGLAGGCRRAPGTVGLPPLVGEPMARRAGSYLQEGLLKAAQPVALSQRTGAPSPARRNGSSSSSHAAPSSFSSSCSSSTLPLAPRAIAARSLFSGMRMSPLAPVVAAKSPRLGV